MAGGCAWHSFSDNGAPCLQLAHLESLLHRLSCCDIALLALQGQILAKGSGDSEAHTVLSNLEAVGRKVMQAVVHEVVATRNPVLTAVLALRQHIPAVISVVLHDRPAQNHSSRKCETLARKQACMDAHS